jgi:hypothetical protein
MENQYQKCMAYLEKLPPALSGSGGHNATLNAALACKRFGLTSSDIWEAMVWYNANRCTPPWKEHELQHKVDSVADLSINKPLGRVGNTRGHVKFTPLPVLERVSDTRPVCQRSEQEEELWWARVAVERGATLEAWDEIL